MDLPHPLRCVHLDLNPHMATERQAQAGPRVPVAPTQLITTEPRAWPTALKAVTLLSESLCCPQAPENL